MRWQMAAVVLAFGAAACGGGASSSSSAPAAGAGGAEFGVAECDDYIKKYTACVDSKVPEASRVMIKQQLDQTKSAWKQAASTADGKAALAAGCKQATEMAKTSMQAYGCTW
jgi:hypothetical protein